MENILFKQKFDDELFKNFFEDPNMNIRDEYMKNCPDVKAQSINYDAILHDMKSIGNAEKLKFLTNEIQELENNIALQEHFIEKFIR
jgi:hypothetical protein